jgi:phosphoenolpyruvate carboxykinase (GTP)
VPVDAFLFGGRRANVVPLVREAFDWEHGVYMGATMSVETTAAAAGEVGALRFDPMAMLPFAGYNMADYMGHWLQIGRREGARLPRIFTVNWFRKGEDGTFLWPGFGDNARVLAWIFRRLDGEAEARETPIGRVPRPEDLELDGLDLDPENLEELLSVDEQGLKAELEQVSGFLERFGERLPAEMRAQHEALQRRLA